MACGIAKAAVVASYAGLVASLAIEFGSAGTLTIVAVGGALLSIIGLIGSLSELHTCLVEQGKIDEANKIKNEIDTLEKRKARLEQLLAH